MFSFLRKKKQFFSKEDTRLIVEAIRHAEQRTSGEVRIFVESRCSYMDALDRAIELFTQMGMNATKERNAVLLYVAIKDHQLAVFGDEGIHHKVGPDYWNTEVIKMLRDFNRDNYAVGIAGCIEDIGQALQQHFPYTDKDKNELSDEIQFGRKTFMKFFFTVIFFLFTFCALAQIGKEIPKKPSPPKLVNDYTNTLTPAQVQALENKLVAYDDSTSNQVAIVIIPSLQGYDISEYGLALGREWGIGGKEFNNGLIILVAKDDRKVRIEVGYGLEGAIPDITAKSIIDNSITPNFKEDNYYRGLDRAADDIVKAAAGEYKAPSGYGNKKQKGKGLGSIIALVLVLLILGGMGGGRKGGGGGAMSGAGWMILGSMLGSGSRGGGGSSGGGGFGGFGGGGFGGGGASGSW